MNTIKIKSFGNSGRKITTIIFLLSFLLIFLSGNIFGFGAISDFKKSFENHDNWPDEIKRQCTLEQSRVILECSQSGFQNWVVYQTVKGEGTYRNRDVSMSYMGRVVGNYDCDPPETREKNGFLVDDIFRVNSRFVDRHISNKSDGKIQNANFICHFSCVAWNCTGGKSLEEKLAEKNKVEKKKIFCLTSIFEEGITPQEREFLDVGWLNDTEKEKIEERQREAKIKLTKWVDNHHNLLEKMCEEKGKNCIFKQIHSREVKLKELVEDEEFWGAYEEAYTGEILVERCWYCICFNIKRPPKTTLSKDDLEKAKEYIIKYGKDNLLRNIDQASIAPKFKGIGSASGHVADLTITSNANESITISIKPSGLEGLLLKNPNPGEQNLVITYIPGISTGPTSYKPTDKITLEPNKSVTLPVIGYCANFEKKNPSEGIELTLNGLMGKDPLMGLTLNDTKDNKVQDVIDTFENTTFPENFTPDDIHSVKQISIWASQPENKDKTPEDYEKRGYPIKEEYRSIIKDILNESKIDSDEILALSGKKKEEPSVPAEEGELTDKKKETKTPETPVKEIPWIYVAAGVAGILAVLSIYKILKK